MPPRALSVAAPPGDAQGDGQGPGDGGPGGEPIFARRFTADDLATRRVLEDMVEVLSEAGIGPDDVSNAELILAEVLNNVCEHAYADGVGPVELRVERQRGGLRCSVADQGRPMPAGMVPDPVPPVIAPPDHLPEGGFGWHIIRCLTTDLAYRREGGWNRLSLRLPWSGFD